MPMKIKNMKNIDLFCASPASTAICSNNTHSIINNNDKPFHLLNSKKSPHHYTNKKTYFPSSSSPSSSSSSSSPRKSAPCISELPFTPRPSTRYSFSKPKLTSNFIPARKTCANISDLYTTNNDNANSNTSSRNLLEQPFLSEHNTNIQQQQKEQQPSRKSLSLLHPRAIKTRPISEVRELRKSRSEVSRLGSSSLIVMDVNNNNNNMSKDKSKKKSEPLDYSSLVISKQKTEYDEVGHKGMVVNSSSTIGSNANQVVVLKVSLHCKGCEGKLRKHLSKMEGVTSFSIDMETKKVTVVGKVTPSSVLDSITKVKNAQYWPSPMSTSS